MTPEELQQFARRGALEEAKRAVEAFPDILPELSRYATTPRAIPTTDAAPPPRAGKTKRRPMSAAGRAAISAAQKARWRRQHREARGADGTA